MARFDDKIDDPPRIISCSNQLKKIIINTTTRMFQMPIKTRKYLRSRMNTTNLLPTEEAASDFSPTRSTISGSESALGSLKLTTAKEFTMRVVEIIKSESDRSPIMAAAHKHKATQRPMKPSSQPSAVGVAPM